MLLKKNIYIYTENRVQVHVGPVPSASVSVSLYDLCSVDLEGLIILVPVIQFGSYTLSASSSVEFSEL